MQSEVAFLADALVKSTPLIIAGLAVTLAFRAGVFNIGAEGQLLVGAAAAAFVGVAWKGTLGNATLIVSLAAAGIAGSAWAGIAAELKRRFHVLEIISTIMLNFIAIYLVSFLVRGPLQEPTHIYPQTQSIPAFARLPLILTGTRLHLGFAIAVTLGILLSWILKRTAVGFRIRAAGASPLAARITGKIDVSRTAFIAFLLSGTLAGIAGGVEVTGVTFALYENLSPGYGYTAIAVALIAGLNPLGVVGSGIFFGALETGAVALQREFAVPAALASVVEAALILTALTLAAARGRNLLSRVSTS